MDAIEDLEAFAALAPTLGLRAQRETLLDVVVGVLDDGAGVPWLRKHRRDRIRRAARARKARRGWR